MVCGDLRWFVMVSLCGSLSYRHRGSTPSDCHIIITDDVLSLDRWIPFCEKDVRKYYTWPDGCTPPNNEST